MDDIQAIKTYPKYSWVYNKLDLAMRLGYDCGIDGDFPKADGAFITRPIVNPSGMGLGAREVFGTVDTPMVTSPGHFWCEKFKGDHISIDYLWGKPQLVVVGYKDPLNTFIFTRWEKVNGYLESFEFAKRISVPEVLKDVVENVEWINIEMIGDKIIEVHLRRNPDFLGHNSEYVRPAGSLTTPDNGETFISRPDYGRLGFYIKGNITDEDN